MGKSKDEGALTVADLKNKKAGIKNLKLFQQQKNDSSGSYGSKKNCYYV